MVEAGAGRSGFPGTFRQVFTEAVEIHELVAIPVSSPKIEGHDQDEAQNDEGSLHQEGRGDDAEDPAEKLAAQTG